MQHGRHFRRCLLLYIPAFSIVQFWGCTSAVNNASLVDPPVAHIADDAQAGCAPVASTVNDTAAVAVSSIVQPLLTQAKEFCAAMEYGAADSISREALSILNSEPLVVDTGAPNDPLMDEIIDLYAEALPDTFPTPDEISLQVLQRRMLRSFDSLELSAQDSDIVNGLFNRSAKGFNVPVVWNSRVQRALYYYITRNKRTVDLWRERSAPYLPFMKKMFVDNGLPDDLAYLPLIESGFNPKAYSRSHASGIWQFIRSTGDRYGLRDNYWIDERRDPVASTVAAIRYLKKLYNDFGDWHCALAAYNCGEGGLSRAIAKSGRNDYWQLRLPAETMNYVPLYLASLIIAKNPDFYPETSVAGDAVPFDTVSINDCIDMRDIAAGIGISHDSLKCLNPHILRWCTPPDMTGIRLYLPAGSAAAFAAFHAALPDEKKVRWYRYRIRRGDNLGSIARQFKIPVDGIKSVNRMRGTRIVAGHYIFIPVPVGAAAYAEPEPETTRRGLPPLAAEVPANAKLTVYEVKPGDSVWRLAELFGVEPDQICGWNGLENNQIRVGQVLSIYTVTPGVSTAEITETSPPADVTTHTASAWYIVRAGDTAYRIAQSSGMTVEELCRLNGLDASMPRIMPGDSLRVRAAAAPAVGRALQRSRTPEESIAYVVAPGDNLYRIARNFSIAAQRIRELNHLSESTKIRSGDTLLVPMGAVQTVRKNPETPIQEVVYYKVKSGDNLWRIATNFGVPVERLCRDNNIGASSVLLPGDTLRVAAER